MTTFLDGSQLDRAVQFAAQAHAGQVDKSEYPYIAHVMRVAVKARQLAHDMKLKYKPEQVQTIAVLHDIVEDTIITLNDLKASFPQEVVRDIEVLTRREDETYATYIDRIVAGNHLVHVVKLADLYDHLDPIRIRDIPVELVDRYVKALSKLPVINAA